MCIVGIVVLNYQTWELSLRCMESVHGACAGYPYRIYLVDNASKRPMPVSVRNYLKKNEPRACFIRAETNLGYAAGNNLGIARALQDHCSVIVITNNDIVFKKRAIWILASCLLGNPEIGIAGPKVVSEKGDIQISRCSMKTGMREIFQVYTAAKKIFQRKWKRYYCLDKDIDKASDVYYVSGCCFAISRECAQKVTPLDEGTVLYYEEPILGIHMEQAGYRTVYEPKSVVVHRHGATSNKMQPFMHQCICQSELYYCGKYLGAKRWQLWILYQYRTMLYMVRSISDKRYRKYWKKFVLVTKKMYKNMNYQRKEPDQHFSNML